MTLNAPPAYGIAVSALLVVWVGAFIIGLLSGGSLPHPSRRLPLASKLVMIGAVLCVAVVSSGLLGVGSPYRAYASLIMVGLAGGGIGDVALAGALRWPKLNFVGMAAFAIGHIAYGSAVINTREFENGQTSSFIGMALGAIGGVVLWRWAVYTPTGDPLLNRGSLAYGILLVGVSGLSLALVGTGVPLALLASGLVLFVLSDGLLAQSLVRRRVFPYLHLIVWSLYSTAQMLIAISAGAASFRIAPAGY